ncbi:hypothetical protein Nepgr_022883 [Nepenthes gracilis]|uniref:Uncharacterized protein n=1 Tax=Nepenthes gracilis TaxID=150966 RepID=A0AAD3T1S4_NEPGR|nr:hypothetical protein Nepgr_022883 [Nepenthes gracilis]
MRKHQTSDLIRMTKKYSIKVDESKKVSEEEPTKGPSVCASQSYSDRVDVETKQLVVDPNEDPFEKDVSDTSSKSVADKSIHQSESVSNNSREKKRPLDATADESTFLNVHQPQKKADKRKYQI